MKQKICTILLGEVPLSVRGELFQLQKLKSAPAYASRSVPTQIILGEKITEIDDRVVKFTLKGFPPDVLLIQCTIEVETIFQKEIFTLEERIFHHAQKILHAYGGNPDYSEDYSIFIISDYQGEPEQFFTHAPMIASLLKSERLELDPREVEYTLQAQIKYAKNDLAIIDWDGAILFDPEGDTDEDMELLILANLQLLRHRILDRQLEEQLAEMSEMVQKRSMKDLLVRSEDLIHNLQEIIRIRMNSISQLQRLERDIKLIGDWYPARFYELATRKFKIEEWRKAIQSKIELLEDIYSIVVENFSVSAKHRAEWIQIIAFFILQAGWFIIIILEFFYFTRD
jgi:hypothetical protein